MNITIRAGITILCAGCGLLCVYAAAAHGMLAALWMAGALTAGAGVATILLGLVVAAGDGGAP